MVYPPKSVSLTPAERKDLPTPPPVAQELKNQKFKIDYSLENGSKNKLKENYPALKFSILKV